MALYCRQLFLLRLFNLHNARVNFHPHDPVFNINKLLSNIHYLISDVKKLAQKCYLFGQKCERQAANH